MASVSHTPTSACTSYPRHLQPCVLHLNAPLSPRPHLNLLSGARFALRSPGHDLLRGPPGRGWQGRGGLADQRGALHKVSALVC